MARLHFHLRYRIRRLKGRLSHLSGERRGAVLIEAAVALPLLIMLLLGIVTYGGWFMAAHTLQQAANEAARAAVPGMDSAERRSLVETSLAQGTLRTGTLQPELVTHQVTESGGYMTVTLNYPVADARIFRTSFVPLPAQTIRRSSVMQVSDS